VERASAARMARDDLKTGGCTRTSSPQALEAHRQAGSSGAHAPASVAVRQESAHASCRRSKKAKEAEAEAVVEAEGAMVGSGGLSWA
jgi:hypothetical protein